MPRGRKPTARPKPVARPTPSAGRTKLSYDLAKQYARSLKLRNREEWRQYVRTHGQELDAKGIPHAPDIFYISTAEKFRRVLLRNRPSTDRIKPRTWVGWKDWLGTGSPRPRRIFLSRSQFDAWLKAHGITSKAAYARWRHANPTHADLSRLPSTPQLIYTSFSWKAALGKAPHTRGAQPQQFAPFLEVRRAARALARQEGFTKASSFTLYVTAHPEWLQTHRCPKRPDASQYAGWRGWHDFLGINTTPTVPFRRD